jgi:hypothetical protein
MKKIVWCSVGTLIVKHIMFLSQIGLVLDHCLPVGTKANGLYYCKLLQGKIDESGSLPLTTQTAWAFYHFAPGQCNTSSSL